MERGSLCLLLKFLIARHYNKEAFKQMLRRIWHTQKQIKFYKLGTGWFLAEFKYVNDKEHVQRDGPWILTSALY